jgi:exopolyphosphatase/pppGpp-phosphohydrolase
MRMINRQEAGPHEDFKAEGIPASTLIRKVDLLWSLSLSERKRLIGLKKKRADVIPFGAVLFETAMRMLDFTQLRVSKRGIRYGAVQLRPEG